VAAQCAVAAGQLQGVLDEMIYNRVGPPAEQRRLSERIIAPLLEICKKPMTDVAAAADQASKDTDLQATRRFTADAAGVFDGFYQRLDEILREMKELESRQELANQLKRIIEWSEELRERIARQVQRQGGLIFDSTTQPTQPAPPG
jgi:uncharacterized membrane protein YccC